MNKEIVINGSKICYRVSGHGNPVVLLHGFGEDGTVWKQQAPSNSPEGGKLGPSQTPPSEGLYTSPIEHSSLFNKFQFIIPDLPGSDKSELINDMSMEGMAGIIKEILFAEAIPICTMIGHSMGGYITLAFAEKYPELLNGFGLFHSSSYADSEEKKATRRKGIEFIKEHGAFEFLKTATPNLYSPITKDERPELIDEQLAGLRNFSSIALVNYYEAMMQRPDRTTVLKETPLPVLFMMGKYDNAVPMKDSLEQCHLPGKSYIHILHNAGHMGMLEEPGKSNKMLKDFLLDI
ncbi:MAG TPA: alpha/beta hydrolase [Chitinophagaceae bacterium]